MFFKKIIDNHETQFEIHNHRSYLLKKIILAAVVFSLTLNLFADEVEDNSVDLDSGSPYKNLREAKSHLISSSDAYEVNRRYRNTKETDILRSIISDKEVNGCATKVVASLKRELNLGNEKEVEFAILGLRLDDSIDDVSASILLKVNSFSSVIPIPVANDDLNGQEEDKALEIFKSKLDDFQKDSSCIEDTYRGLVSKLVSDTPKFYKNLKHINKLALKRNLISKKQFKILECMRINKVHEWPISLSEYAQNLKAIAKKFPARKKESAQLVTDVKFHQKNSLRQSLYEKYNSTQIMLLANIVRDLKARLESKDVTININYENREAEIINLSPMEKFRFILKLLRKELSNINNSTLLGGRRATYMDLMAASYEVDYVNSLEIEQLSSLQEIWNPSRTTKDKVVYWIKHFGGMSSVFLPPPYGFVSVLVIMLIDQQLSESPVNRDSDFNIF